MADLDRQTRMLASAGRLEELKGELDTLRSRLAGLTLWRPAAVLGRQCERAAEMIDGIAARFERSLVVTLIGPCGSGKSTLFNALAGRDELSPTGRRRPTTDRLVVFSRRPGDAGQLAREIGGGPAVVSGAGGGFPEGVCLVDTPDTDSAALARHRPLVEQAVAAADMLICVFDAENPKRRDHADFLAPLVARFDGQSLIAVLNKCDRLDAGELEDVIRPDFQRYLEAAWGAAPEIYCVSARRHLQSPDWDEDAGPRHDLDEFDRLRTLVRDSLPRGGFAVDRRLENARRLQALVLEEAARQLAADRPPLEAAAGEMAEAEKAALSAAVDALRGDQGRYLAGVGVMLYHRLSQRWVGPVGWMVAVWTRLMFVGAGLVSILRFGRPVAQAMGLVSAWRHLKDSRQAASGTHVAERVDAAVRAYRLALMRRWPAIAEKLVAGGFADEVRGLEAQLGGEAEVGRELSERWDQALEARLERLAARLSAMVLQVLFNAPALGVLGYIGYLTVVHFFRRTYLTGDFFVHAAWVLAIVLLLSFFLLQAVVRLAGGPERLAERAFADLRRDVQGLTPMVDSPVKAQLAGVLQLAEAAAGGSRQAGPMPR